MTACGAFGQGARSRRHAGYGMVLCMFDLPDLLSIVRRLHDRMRDRVLQAAETRSTAELSQVVAEQGGDVVFAIDQFGEEELIDFVSREIAAHEPIVLVAEGLPEGKVVLPEGATEEQCRWRMIVDPIDGTRPIMFQKRSAWILTGVAANRGPETGLADIRLAVQTEIPLLKQHLGDQMWAIRGEGAGAVQNNRLTGESKSLELRPSAAETIRMGFSTICRFFPGVTDVLASINDELVRRALGPSNSGGTLCFEDQYASTGGQIHGLLSGADRFVADLRPLMAGIARQRGQALAHCCHPYDICTALIAKELGVQITAVDGGMLDVPLDVETNVAWLGYANAAIRGEVEPVLLEILRERKLISS